MAPPIAAAETAAPTTDRRTRFCPLRFRAWREIEEHRAPCPLPGPLGPVELLAQALVRALQAALHGLDGLAEPRRDVARREPVVVAQQDDRPLRRVERGQRVDDGAQRLLPDQEVDGPLGPLGPGRGPLATIPPGLVPPAAPRDVAHGPDQPRPRAPGVGGDPSERPGEGLLRDVVGLRVVANQRPGQPTHEVRVGEEGGGREGVGGGHTGGAHPRDPAGPGSGAREKSKPGERGVPGLPRGRVTVSWRPHGDRDPPPHRTVPRGDDADDPRPDDRRGLREHRRARRRQPRGRLPRRRLRRGVGLHGARDDADVGLREDQGEGDDGARDGEAAPRPPDALPGLRRALAPRGRLRRVRGRPAREADHPARGLRARPHVRRPRDHRRGRRRLRLPRHRGHLLGGPQVGPRGGGHPPLAAAGAGEGEWPGSAGPW